MLVVLSQKDDVRRGGIEERSEPRVSLDIVSRVVHVTDNLLHEIGRLRLVTNMGSRAEFNTGDLSIGLEHEYPIDG